MTSLSTLIFVLSTFSLYEALNGDDTKVEILAVVEKELSDEFKLDIWRKSYFCRIFNEVQRYYDTIEGVKIKIILSGLKIITESKDQPFIERWTWKKGNRTYLRTICLQKFSRFAQQQLWSKEYDVIFLLTRKAIADVYSEIDGIAYKYGTCNFEEKFGVMVPDPKIIAHELAHLLGASNDGSRNPCSSDDGFVMAEYSHLVTENYGRFSSCSTDAIKMHLKSPKSYCLRRNDVQNTVMCENKTSFHDICYPVSSVVSRMKGGGKIDK